MDTSTVLPAYPDRSTSHCCQPAELPDAAFHVPVLPVRGLDRNRGADGQGGRCENDGVMTSHQNLRRTLGDAEIRQTLRAFRGR